MNRRELLAASGAMLAAPFVGAQSAKSHRVALVFGPHENAVKAWERAFLEELRARGYVQGRNLVFDVRYADGDSSRVPALVDGAIALRPDVLVGFESVVRVMKARTSTIPIVLTHSSDPVGLGLAQSLARPGANVTGISMLHEQIVAKVIEIFREFLPRLNRLALILDSTSPGSRLAEENARKAAAVLHLTVVPYYAGNRAELENAMAGIARDRLDGLMIGGPLPAILSYASWIADEAARSRLPFAFSGSSENEVRAIFWFGASLPQAYRDAARYVDRVLKGASPAALPIEQPTRFELVVNVKHAKSLGIPVPRSVLLRADRVIE